MEGFLSRIYLCRFGVFVIPARPQHTTWGHVNSSRTMRIVPIPGTRSRLGCRRISKSLILAGVWRSSHLLGRRYNRKLAIPPRWPTHGPDSLVDRRVQSPPVHGCGVAGLQQGCNALAISRTHADDALKALRIQFPTLGLRGLCVVQSSPTNQANQRLQCSVPVFGAITTTVRTMVIPVTCTCFQGC